MSELEASESCSPQCAEADKIKSTDDINPETVQNTNTNISQVEEESQSDSDLLKGLLTDNFCHVCEATLLYESQRVSHYEGKKHAQRVRMYLQNKKAKINKPSQDCGGLLRGLSAEKFCELCNMVFSSPTVAKSHYEGKVHAKNMRKTNLPPPAAPVLELHTAPVVVPSEAAVQNQISQEQKDTSGLGDQEVDLSDPNKYCTLCSASFNNPLVAQQHYSGRKHQRNQARQEMLDQMGEQSERVSSLTPDLLSDAQLNRDVPGTHAGKQTLCQKKVMDLCKSQKKVYDSFQDELADYIQVQKARGLEPKAGPGTVGQASKGLDESESEGPQKAEEMPHPAQLVPRFPPPGFPQPHWHPQFQPQVNQFGFGMRGPVPHYPPGYMPHTHPPFTPGHLYKRERSPESFSSSSFSDSSSYSSSSSNSSSSYDSRERRRRKRKMKKRGKTRRDQEEGSDTERGERKKRRKRDRRGSVEGEEDRKKWKERRKRERSSSEDEETRSKRRASKKSKRHGDGQHAKRRKEEELLEKQEVEVHEEPQGKMEEHVEVRTEMKDSKHKHKKEKKKGKEKTNPEDNRTEEERLWDETILGVF
ncbi:Zinc finger matrin-type protein 1 [Labeo rohita]|uniref:Lysine-rich coiled-coil protein 1 n=1 Tax=Labeo rohita TaxID=84645 RepID=A0ABQ8LPE7_LABRO|nr:Zinc finger matrin-type protein 1 [Labeo rohita]